MNQICCMLSNISISISIDKSTFRLLSSFPLYIILNDPYDHLFKCIKHCFVMFQIWRDSSKLKDTEKIQQLKRAFIDAGKHVNEELDTIISSKRK